MYYPYFRGKQFELITIRETANLLAESNFVPIIEPVRADRRQLERTLEAMRDAEAATIVIVNPHYGRADSAEIGDLVEDFVESGTSPGILLRSETSLQQAVDLYEGDADREPTLIHDGFRDGRALAEALGDDVVKEMRHVFIDSSVGRIYRRHFPGAIRVLVRDGFKRRTRNRDHPPVEQFSDLHITHGDEGMTGFGDFLVVGDDYSDGGGPAYTVAIHLTFIDRDQEDEMFIYHFLSHRQDTMADPAGKFGEALEAMIKKLDEPDSKVLETSAVQEFRRLYQDDHFPGLGYVKKLSMKHHLETLADYLV